MAAVCCVSPVPRMQILISACWICLPPEARPKDGSWSKFRRPVVRLIRALYGHPDSGTTWEKHCDTHLRKAGFVPIGDEWRSAYSHKELRILLVVYVDDFKMSGPKVNLKSGWDLINRYISIEPPTPLGVFLGCGHKRTTFTLPSGVVARGVEYNMRNFLEQRVQRYLDAAPTVTKLTKYSTPFFPEDRKESQFCAPQSASDASVTCPWCRHSFDAIRKAGGETSSNEGPPTGSDGVLGDARSVE